MDRPDTRPDPLVWVVDTLLPDLGDDTMLRIALAFARRGYVSLPGSPGLAHRDRGTLDRETGLATRTVREKVVAMRHSGLLLARRHGHELYYVLNLDWAAPEEEPL